MKTRLLLIALLASFSAFGQSPCNNQTSITYQGYEYDIVEIGDQCWFAENLRSHLYLNGDSINYITSPEEWENTLAGAVTEMQTYNPCSNVFDPSVCTIEGYYFETYGRLYNGYAIEDQRPLCPNNWRVPTDSDFVSMLIHLGMTEVEATSFGMHGTIGSELKASTLWFNGSNGTDLHGFKGLPGGYIDASGGNQNAGSTGHWWTQTPHNASIITRALNGPSDGVYRDAGHKWLGYSIRCINEVFDYGCTNEQACNFSPNALEDDGSCIYIGDPCDDEDANTVDDEIQDDCECAGTPISTIDELEALSVLIYPNPASNNLTVDLGDLKGVNTTIKLYDSSSKLVFEKESTATLMIDVSGFAKGLYSLELSTEQQVLRSQVIVE